MKEEILDRLGKTEDSVRKRALFAGLLSREIVNRGGKPLVIVGGEAVELYTQGSYTTGDIDIKSPKKLTEEILEEWGFEKSGRVWFNGELDIYIDWLGESLDEGPEAEKRINTVTVAEGIDVSVISIEDLIIDRLNACKYWNDSDSLMWAKVLLKVKESMKEDVDRDYLFRRAGEEGIEDFLNKLLG